nr:LysR family transcriptional regulator [Gammaproteobacteria bacterium]
MRHSTFRQLEIFEAVARLSSFRRAAEALFLSQPTVSMQVSKLSETVGAPLFEQIGKRIFLTEAGRELLVVTREIFDQLRRFEMTLNDMRGLKSGSLRLAAVTTAKFFVPRLLGVFCQRFPGIDVALKVSNRERILERLADNRDDLYVLGEPPEDIDVEAEPFLENPLVPFAAANHPLAGEKTISLARFAQEPFLMREPGSGTRMAVGRLLAAHGLKVHVRMELGSNEAIKQAVIGGMGVTVLSRHTLPSADLLRNVAILNVEHFPIQRAWYVVYPCGKRLSKVAETFRDYMLTEAG